MQLPKWRPLRIEENPKRTIKRFCDYCKKNNLSIKQKIWELLEKELENGKED